MILIKMEQKTTIAILTFIIIQTMIVGYSIVRNWRNHSSISFAGVAAIIVIAGPYLMLPLYHFFDMKERLKGKKELGETSKRLIKYKFILSCSIPFFFIITSLLSMLAVVYIKDVDHNAAMGVGVVMGQIGTLLYSVIITVMSSKIDKQLRELFHRHNLDLFY